MATSVQHQEDRWYTIREIWHDYRLFYRLSGGLILVMCGVLMGGVFFAADPGYFTNLYTEGISVLLTIAVLNYLAERREERRERARLKADLIAKLGSFVNIEALQAADGLRRHGWLEDGSLRGVDLRWANLRGARLRRADLQDAFLLGARLQGADLLGANLQGADLTQTRFDENTILPDSDWDAEARKWTRTWTLETDMTRYTDTDHPAFWRASDPRSPAYRSTDGE